jgi:hypothetical protein
MYKSVTVYKEVEVDVELDDFDDYDLIDELERRGRGFDVAGPAPTELVRRIYEKRRLGNNNYQQELDELIYVTLGKIV